jgi:hypothetical protein
MTSFFEAVSEKTASFFLSLPSVPVEEERISKGTVLQLFLF